MLYNASSASTFIGSLGVNVHVSWPGWYPYSDTAKVIGGMNYLGLDNMRDYMNSATTGVYNTLAASGFHFDLMYNENDNIGDYFNQVHNLEAAHPGAILSLEGPNEVNGFTALATTLQQGLYARANADPLLADKPVYAATLAGLDPTVYSQLQINGYADDGNVHIYYNGGQPAFGWSPSDPTYYWTNWLSSGNYDVPGKPVVVTETGSTTSVGSTGMEGVDEPTQAKQILNSFMDAARTGTPMTYIYELVESHNNGPTDPESHFGLFRYDWTPKLAATAIHNFTTVLTDGGALTGAPGSLDYTVQGVPQWGGQMLFQQADGTKDVVVWAEPDIWNDSTNTPITAPNTPVTIDLATAASVSIYDPLLGSTPVQTLGVTSHIAFNVTDHPLIIEVKPASGSTNTTAIGADVSTVGTPGNDVLHATSAVSSIDGGAGADTITGSAGPDQLWGGDGADSIQGGAGFDAINGNKGDDTIDGGAGGSDWLVGGQGNDLITAHAGDNYLQGNLGDDTLYGGTGADTIHGGKGDDVLVAGSGRQWLSGDLGNDTLTGGSGPDTFHSFSGAGIDLVTNFNAAKGDHVQLDPGTSYQLLQSGADVIVDMGNGDELILKNVQLSSLPTGWLIEA